MEKEKSFTTIRRIHIILERQKNMFLKDIMQDSLDHSKYITFVYVDIETLSMLLYFFFCFSILKVLYIDSSSEEI